MTREDVKKIFTNATDEEITKILNAHNGELATEKAAAKKATGERDALQKKIDDAELEGKSDLEKLQGQIDALTEKFNAATAENITLKRKASLAAQGIVGEDADKILDSMKDGNVDFAVLGKIIEAKSKAAVAEAEKKWLEETPGGGHDDGGDKEGADVAFAKKVGFGATGNNEAKNVLGMY